MNQSLKSNSLKAVSKGVRVECINSLKAVSKGVRVECINSLKAVSARCKGRMY